MWSVWLVFSDCVFHSVCTLEDNYKRLMEASSCERLTERETGSCSDGQGHAQWIFNPIFCWWAHPKVLKIFFYWLSETSWIYFHIYVYDLHKIWWCKSSNFVLQNFFEEILHDFAIPSPFWNQHIKFYKKGCWDLLWLELYWLYIIWREFISYNSESSNLWTRSIPPVMWALFSLSNIL